MSNETIEILDGLILFLCLEMVSYDSARADAVRLFFVNPYCCGCTKPPVSMNVVSLTVRIFSYILLITESRLIGL